MLSNASAFRRIAVGVALIAGPLLFVIGDALSSAWADESAVYYNELVENPSREAASGAAYVFGMTLMVPALIGIARLIRGRGVVLANIALVLGVLGFGVFPALAGGALYEAAVVEVIAQADYVAITDELEESVWAVIVLAVALLGALLSLILIAIAIGRSGLAPWWVSGVLIVSALLVAAGGSSQALNLASSALLLVALGYLALRVFSMSDAEWEHPAPDPPGPEPDVAA